jgi:cell wall-associated NlpC family hydrolase
MKRALASTRVHIDPHLTRLRFAAGEVKRILTALPTLRRAEEPVLLLSIATVVVALAVIGVRSHHQPLPTFDGYLAASKVSFQAFALPAAEPSRPVVREQAQPRYPVVSIALPTSPLPRAEGVRRVLATARSLIGHPYRYGASGPSAFDCSGFTSFVWRAAGLSLPHNSGAQYASLPRVSLEDLQPGDLIFSGSRSIGHVALYVGNGMEIDAPETGGSVTLRAIHSNVMGAARPALLLRDESSARVEARAR